MHKNLGDAFVELVGHVRSANKFVKLERWLKDLYDGFNEEDKKDLDSGLYYFRANSARLAQFGVKLKPINLGLKQ